MAGAVASAVRLRGSIAAFSSLQPVITPAVQVQTQRGFVSKSLRDPDYKRPTPYPYETKNYNLFRAMFDHVTPRMDENSKIIVVDGPPTGNKTEFAKKIAEELDMLHIPNASIANYFLTPHGYDMRKLDDKLPLSCRSFDIHQFLQNPHHRNVANMQLHLYLLRLQDYIKATAHVLSTGQGVVMNRSIYSDYVFLETCLKHKFVSQEARNLLTKSRNEAMYEFMRPHLVIYLDIPVNTVIDNIKKRNKPYEQGSKFYTPEVLGTLEDLYKKDYLKKISKHAEVLIYDWSEEGEAEVVVEDICRIDMDRFTQYDTQMQDWRFDDEWDWKYKRLHFCNENVVEEMLGWAEIPGVFVKEMMISAYDIEKYERVMDTTPETQYSYGYNKHMGDNYLLNTK